MVNPVLIVKHGTGDIMVIDTNDIKCFLLMSFSFKITSMYLRNNRKKLSYNKGGILQQ